MKQIPLAIAPVPQATLDSYLPGANAAAVQHLRALAPPAPPVYLWGPASSGKTHLLEALAGRARAAGRGVGWFDAADPAPWGLASEWVLVVVDRCEALDAEAQHAAFTLFVEAAMHGVQFVAAGRLPPVDLPLRDDLRTRLAWGHVFALQPLSEADTRAALRHSAGERGIVLADEVLDYLLTRFPRDLAHLMSLLDRLDDFGLVKSRGITVPLLRQMLAEEGAVASGAA
jgi:DnaA family protein